MEGTLDSVKSSWDEYLNRCSEGVAMLTPSMGINEKLFNLSPCFDYAACPPDDILRCPASFIHAIYDQAQGSRSATGEFGVCRETGEPGPILNYKSIQKEIYRLGAKLHEDHRRVFDNLARARVRYFAAFLKLIVLLPEVHDVRTERKMLDEEFLQIMESEGGLNSSGPRSREIDRRRNTNDRELQGVKMRFIVAHKGVALCTRQFYEAKKEAERLLPVLFGRQTGLHFQSTETRL
ncbi:hypothetical protein PRK78_003820 [Emydomyces testavorans]|uniref:Uncharacterized protein n=1 Tax=Emydomyces testavorans TaxID=2070801 RepID=A0AAF0DGX1_9EURO|nr:hypothetical protein PRK78_003820 [Emydomyces testavorans]